MPAVLLLGFMCSGKTTLGRALARRLGVTFTDLDLAVEERLGMSVAEIFRQKGEEAFRKAEKETLNEVLRANPDGIIALGGGTPCREGAMEQLNAAGTTVWLIPSEERLVGRLIAGRQKRPLLRDIDTEDEMKEFARKKLAEREKYYRSAHHRFNSSFLENENEIAETVTRFIQEILPLADSD